MQPKYGGMIIDIVSTEIRTPEQQAEALEAIKDTILDIVLIVVIGYDILSCICCTKFKYFLRTVSYRSALAAILNQRTLRNA